MFSLFIGKQNKAKHRWFYFFVQQIAKAKHSRVWFIFDFISWWLLLESKSSCPFDNFVSGFRSSSSSSNVRYNSASEAVRVDIERSISEHESSQVSTLCPSEFNSVLRVLRRRCNSVLRDDNRANSFSYSRSFLVKD